MRDEFVPVDPTTVAELLKRLGRVDPLSARFERMRSVKPAPKSPAWHDVQSRNGELPWGFGALSIGVAIDHMRAWLLLAQGGRLTERAPITLARASIESAVTCLWLLDRKQDHAERIKRACALQLQDYRYRSDVEQRLGAKPTGPPDDAELAHQRAATLRREMAYDGIEEIPVLSMTDRFAEYSIGGWFYGVLSAFAHGRQWAMLLSEIGERKSIPGLAGLKSVRVKSRDELTLQVATAVSLALHDAVDAFEWYARTTPASGGTPTSASVPR